MNLEFFDKNEVEISLEDDGYFIHTHTSNKARTEASDLAKYISKNLNEANNLEDSEWNENRIIVLNQEVSPACNYGILYRSDKFEHLYCKEDTNLNKLIIEIENQKK